MTKKILFLFAALVASTAWAGERTLKDWLKDLDARLRRTEQRRKDQIAGVAAVRGAKQEDVGKLYWKGRKGNRAVTLEEVDAFKKAVALAQEGKAVRLIWKRQHELAVSDGSTIEEEENR